MMLSKRRTTVPCITRETSFGQHACKLVLGVHIFELDFGVQIDPHKQPIQRDSAGSGHVSHRWTCPFDDHFDHRFIVLKKMYN